MSTYLLDTNTISKFIKGNDKIASKINLIPSYSVCTSTIILAELYYGCENANSLKIKQILLKVYDDMFKEFRVIPFDAQSAKVFSKIKKNLKNIGKMSEDFDILIAAQAIAHDMVLVTNNTKHFEQIEDLKLEDWSE